MPRRLRKDEPGTWHHVVSRGVARRTVFESHPDVRKLLACLARTVREGRIEVHAYSVLTTHYHLLLRSPKGDLSAVMHDVLAAYSTRFNRTRLRDGPLFRNRFWNDIVEGDDHLVAVVRYIDRNAVEAGLALHPGAYTHGSAQAYLSGKAPRWLSTEHLFHLARDSYRRDPSERAYSRLYCEGFDPATLRWSVERRFHWGGRARKGRSPLWSSPTGVILDLQVANRNADGIAHSVVVARPETVMAAVEWVMSHREPSRSLHSPRMVEALREVLQCRGLNELAGLSQRETARLLGKPHSWVRRRLRDLKTAGELATEHLATFREVARRTQELTSETPDGLSASLLRERSGLVPSP